MLALLLVVYALNFLDRQILGILAIPIKAEMGLSDASLGALSGLAFALFYTGLGLPIAWAADRGSRSGIVAASLAAWSLFTGLSGLATGYWQLFACRIGVGVGEAGGVAPAYALIADSFPTERRGRAYAIYSFGIPVGSALGLAVGGWIAGTAGWRAAFLIVGGIGLAFAPLFRLLVREPRRGRFDPPGAAATAPAPAAALRALAGLPAFRLLTAGGALASMAGYGILFWLPPYIQRTFLLPVAQVGAISGGILLFGGLAGVWAGGWLGDRLGRARPGAYALVPAAGFTAAVPLYALALSTPALWLAIPLLALASALALMWLAPVTAAVQRLVPSPLRATAAAVFLLANSLIGQGLGSFAFGLLSDGLTARYGAAALKMSLLIGLCLYPVAALLMAFAARALNRAGAMRGGAAGTGLAEGGVTD